MSFLILLHTDIWDVFFSSSVFHANNRLSSIFPESCMLLLLGMMVGGIFYATSVTGYQMDAKTFFYVLLPPIILEAGTRSCIFRCLWSLYEYLFLPFAVVLTVHVCFFFRILHAKTRIF